MAFFTELFRKLKFARSGHIGGSILPDNCSVHLPSYKDVPPMGGYVPHWFDLLNNGLIIGRMHNTVRQSLVRLYSREPSCCLISGPNESPARLI